MGPFFKFSGSNPICPRLSRRCRTFLYRLIAVQLAEPRSANCQLPPCGATVYCLRTCCQYAICSLQHSHVKTIRGKFPERRPAPVLADGHRPFALIRTVLKGALTVVDSLYDLPVFVNLFGNNHGLFCVISQICAWKLSGNFGVGGVPVQVEDLG